MLYNGLNKKKENGVNGNANPLSDSRWCLWKSRNTAVNPVIKVSHNTLAPAWASKTSEIFSRKHKIHYFANTM